MCDNLRTIMEFRLIYQGPLPSASSTTPRPKEQHAIRKTFHCQLVEFWRGHPHLKQFMEPNWLRPESVVNRVAKNHICGPHKFLPLSRIKPDSFCSLNITFLRRDFPGNLVSHGGDLDNRLKVLLDALRVPQSTKGLPETVEEGFDPIFVLLEDDSQITQLSVTTDRLLAPLGDGQREHDVILIIRVHLYIGTNVVQLVADPTRE